MDNTIANPFKARPTETHTISPERIGGKPDHRSATMYTDSASDLAMRMAEVALRETRGYAHNGWCVPLHCTCRTRWLAAQLDTMMKDAAR